MVLIYSGCGNDQRHPAVEWCNLDKIFRTTWQWSSPFLYQLHNNKISFKYTTFIYWLTPAPSQLPKLVLFLFSLLATHTVKLHCQMHVSHALIKLVKFILRPCISQLSKIWLWWEGIAYVPQTKQQKRRKVWGCSCLLHSCASPSSQLRKRYTRSDWPKWRGKTKQRNEIVFNKTSSNRNKEEISREMQVKSKIQFKQLYEIWILEIPIAQFRDLNILFLKPRQLCQLFNYTLNKNNKQKSISILFYFKEVIFIKPSPVWIPTSDFSLVQPAAWHTAIPEIAQLKLEHPRTIPFYCSTWSREAVRHTSKYTI